MAVTVVWADKKGFDRGLEYAVFVCSEHAVDAKYKQKSGCECRQEKRDVYCRRCLFAFARTIELSGRETNILFNEDIVKIIDSNTGDPTADPSVLWDAFEHGVERGIKETLNKLVKADAEFTMAIRSHRR